MGIIRDFIEYRKVQRLVEQVENKEGKEESRQKLNEIIEKYPELLDEVVNTAKESDQIEDEVIVETLAENIETIVDKEKINEQEKQLLNLGVKAITDIGEDIPDKYLNKVADAARKSKHIDRQTEINVIKHMDDKKEKQKQVAKSLRRIYAVINEKTPDAYIQLEIEKLENIVESSKSINDLKRDIVAKKIAFNYMKNGSTQLYALSQIVPIDEMFMINMPEIVQNQYNAIIKKEKANNSEKEYRTYDKEQFRLELLNEMAKDVACKYEKTGELIISQSQQMKKITPEEESFFINKIYNHTDRKLNKDQINLIQEKIRGNLEGRGTLEEIMNMVEHQPQEQRSEIIKLMKEIVKNEKLREVYDVMKEVELDKTLEGMDRKEIKDRFQVFSRTLIKRKEKDEVVKQPKEDEEPSL